MCNLLCIVGPTGVGKTAKAIEIASLAPSILVSADSRQVYRDMDIVTGKDHPKDVDIYGVDILNPDEPCSVSVWYDAVMPHIQAAWQAKQLVIVVGGTGLYFKALTGDIATIQVPINQSLRDRLSTLSITELQEQLWEADPDKFARLNHSDQDNPRRLVRAIEIATSPQKPIITKRTYESKIIGLKIPSDAEYRNDIETRVHTRLHDGAIEETRKLLVKYDKSVQSMSAIGYRSILAFLEGIYTEEEMVNKWVTDELAYAKRQMTWFAKIDQIKWYDRGVTGRQIYADTEN